MEPERTEPQSVESITRAIMVLAERGEELVKQSALYAGRHRRFVCAFEGIIDLSGQVRAELGMPHTERL